MAHIAYCWELGLGFGHVSRMNQVINDPSLQSCTFSLILKEVHKAAHIEKHVLSRVFQAPIASSAIKESSPNFSHLMSRCGWANDSSALFLVAAWRNIFKCIQPDVVVLDHAPTAGIAALSLDIPVKQIGNGFEIPPFATPMPKMFPNSKVTDNQLITCDKNLQSVLEKVEQKLFGKVVNKLTLKNLFKPEDALIAGSPLLDHYGNRQAPWHYLPQVTNLDIPYQDLEAVKQSDKPVVFFYLDARTPRLLELLNELSKNYILFGYLSYLSDTNLKASLQIPDVHICPNPINMEQALSIAKVVVCNSNFGTLNNIVDKAIPSILIPLHVEQAMVAFQMHKRHLAFAVDRGTPLSEVSRAIESYVKYSDTMRDAIYKSVNEVNQSSSFWQGNLLEDFILSS